MAPLVATRDHNRQVTPLYFPVQRCRTANFIFECLNRRAVLKRWFYHQRGGSVNDPELLPLVLVATLEKRLENSEPSHRRDVRNRRNVLLQRTGWWRIPLKLDLIVLTTLTDRKLQQEPLQRSGPASYRLLWVRFTRKLTVTERQQWWDGDLATVNQTPELAINSEPKCRFHWYCVPINV